MSELVELVSVSGILIRFNSYQTYSQCKNEEGHEIRSCLKPIEDATTTAEENQDEAEGEDAEGEEYSDEEEEDYIFIIDFKDIWAIDFLEHINGKYRLPHIHQIYLDSLEFVNSECRTLIESTITTCSELYINKKPQTVSLETKVDIDYYLESIIKRVKRAECETLLLGYFEIKSEQYNQLVTASRNVSFLSFN